MNRTDHGERRRGPYFEGWYLKCQTKAGESLALIPALHIDASGGRSASLQVVTGRRAWQLDVPCESFFASADAFFVRLGSSVFSSEGMALDVDANGLSLHGRLAFGPFTPLASDIMGPFRLFAGMECAHGVVSMAHSLSGQLLLNGKTFDFDSGAGYIETDRGRSFPSAYLWTQCLWMQPQPVSLMCAVAAIPLPIGRFTGCICAICCDGHECRLATYRGASAERWSREGAVIRQGKLRLEIDVLSAQGLPLRAPVQGRMTRTIRESLCARVRYRFFIRDHLLFDHTDDRASFEFSCS
ncbi:MAG: tocopherol cyclase family protein [Candidatus Ventricola sp.]